MMLFNFVNEIKVALLIMMKLVQLFAQRIKKVSRSLNFYVP